MQLQSSYSKESTENANSIFKSIDLNIRNLAGGYL